MVYRRLFLAGALALLIAAPLAADPADLKDLDKTVFDGLAARASNTVNITLDGAILKMGASFLSSSDDENAAQIKRIVAGLRSISVRSFEFKKKGEYGDADIQAIRSQMKLADWSRIVDVHSKEEPDNAEIYVLPGKDKLQGLFILVSEPLELTAVHILGNIDRNDIDALQKLGRESAKGDQQ